ncbi:MAG TPA: hypothetical protein VGF92_12525 [Stellaceae bacterium]|jgi:hypothetical protein
MRYGLGLRRNAVTAGSVIDPHEDGQAFGIDFEPVDGFFDGMHAGDRDETVFSDRRTSLRVRPILTLVA